MEHSNAIRRYLPYLVAIIVIVAAWSIWFLFFRLRIDPGGPHMTDDQIEAAQARGEKPNL